MWVALGLHQELFNKWQISRYMCRIQFCQVSGATVVGPYAGQSFSDRVVLCTS